MCFWINESKEFKKAKVADRNIVCYKVSNHPKQSRVKNYLRPYFQFEFKYLLSKSAPKQSLDADRSFDGKRYIREGYHSYKDSNHSWVVFKGSMKKIGKFIIPKGTKYYENKTEYVSETLIFKGYIK